MCERVRDQQQGESTEMNQGRLTAYGVLIADASVLRQLHACRHSCHLPLSQALLCGNYSACKRSVHRRHGSAPGTHVGKTTDLRTVCKYVCSNSHMGTQYTKCY